jgi:hypothetical protein
MACMSCGKVLCNYTFRLLIHCGCSLVFLLLLVAETRTTIDIALADQIIRPIEDMERLRCVRLSTHWQPSSIGLRFPRFVNYSTNSSRRSFQNAAR